MSTILFDEIVYGPIHSRRLGSSLGMNILPYDGKVCSFDCVYCECGLNENFRTNTKLPSRTDIRYALDYKLQKIKEEKINLDVITFAGNGEPTLHPEFEGIIDDTIELRNKYFPEVKISVLSNGLQVKKDSVFEALKKVDNPILKLDSGINETAILIDRPNTKDYSVEKQVELYKKFNHDFILQTMILKGEIDGKKVDNSTEEEVSALLEIIKELRPREVMIYTIDRETPIKSLRKASIEVLNDIAGKVNALGIKTNVAG